jgi:hypothetical protein
MRYKGYQIMYFVRFMVNPQLTRLDLELVMALQWKTLISLFSLTMATTYTSKPNTSSLSTHFSNSNRSSQRRSSINNSNPSISLVKQPSLLLPPQSLLQLSIQQQPTPQQLSNAPDNWSVRIAMSPVPHSGAAPPIELTFSVMHVVSIINNMAIIDLFMYDKSSSTLKNKNLSPLQLLLLRVHLDLRALPLGGNNINNNNNRRRIKQSLLLCPLLSLIPASLYL